MSYDNFIASKQFQDIESGFSVREASIDRHLFDFQIEIVKWALRRGRAAAFLDTGLGKTFVQSEWARHVVRHTGGKVLILAPLCVSQQTVKEAARLGIEVTYTREHPKAVTGIFITNYEMMDHFDFSAFQGVVLDESSILKHETSKTRGKLVEACRRVPYRLSCTATPSPNDYMELGNQAEFLGVMNMNEMLAMFFVHDSGETSKWRLKGHGRKRFWEWLSTWAVCIRNPADIGFDGARFKLPKLNFTEHLVETDGILEGELFPRVAQTLRERITARKQTVEARVKRCAEIVNDGNGQWIVWCHRNDESVALTRSIKGAVEVTGSMSVDEKQENILAFTRGDARVIVTKPSVAGFGLNWQHCHKMAFVGLNDSFEEFYQAVRRCYRFGQKKPVEVHIITADLEGAVLENIKRKEAQANEMAQSMVEHMREFTTRRIRSLRAEKTEYLPRIPMTIPSWPRMHFAEVFNG